MNKKRFIGFRFFVFVIFAFVPAVYLMSKSPSHDLNWRTEYEVLPSAAFDGDRVAIKNIRNFAYFPDGEIREVRYYDQTFNMDELNSAWYGISHFGGFGLAHTFLSFGFESGVFLTISVEARLETDESYHPLTGLFRNYELAYVIGDERDIIGLRTHIRKEKVYLYRLEISPDTAKRVFRSMLSIANEIDQTPRFYNTLFDNCTTNLMAQAKNLSTLERIFDYRILLPGYSDELAYEKGVFRTDAPLPEVRKVSLLDYRRTGIEDPQFSLNIRQVK